MQTSRIYSQDIGMKLGIQKYAIIIIREGKRETTERIELHIQENIRKRKYKYLAILDMDTIEQRWKKKRRITQENKKLLEIKLCRRNLTNGINIWVVYLVRQFLK